MFTRALTAKANALRGMQALAERASSQGVASGKLKWHQRVLEDEAYIQRLAAADMVLGTSNIYVDVYARTYTPWLPHPIFICRRVYVYIPCLPPAGAGHILAQLHRHGAGCALGGDPGRQHGVLARVLARRRLGLDCRGDPAGVGAGPARLCRGRACARAPQVCLVCLPCVSAYVCAFVSAYDAVARALVGLSQQQARRHELRRRLAAARDEALFDSRRWIAAWERWLALAVDAHEHASPGRRCVHARDACGVHVIAAG